MLIGNGLLRGESNRLFHSSSEPATPISASASQYHGSRSSYDIGQSTIAAGKSFPLPYRVFISKSARSIRGVCPSQCHVEPPVLRSYPLLYWLSDWSVACS